MTGAGDLPALRRFDSSSSLQVQAALRRDDLAVVDDERSLTFGELLGSVLSFATELRDRGVRSGDVVAVCLPNVWQYVVLEIAVPALDAVLLPLPPRLGRHEFAFALDTCNPRIVLVEDRLSWRGPDTRSSVVAVDELRTDRTDGPDLSPSVDPDRIVEIALTSGTTGMPKFASLSARLKQLTFEAFTARLGVGPGDRMLPMSPICQGVGEICMYVMRAGAGVVMTRDHRFDPDDVLRLIERSRATLLGGVPTMLGRLLHAPALDEVDLSRLRATASAGAPLAPSAAREWERRSGSAVCGFYGAMDLGHLSVVRPSDPPTARWTTVGQPHDTADWQVCTPDGRPVAPGVEGEICMRGPLVQARYWNSTETPYTADGWAHFGDLGFVDDAGFVHITGRVKDTIIRGGNNINPLEVENVLRRHPAVRDVVVVGRPDPDLGERAVAFVDIVPGAEITLAELTRALEHEGMARHKWPEALAVVDGLPLAATGKPDRAALRERVAVTATDEKGAHDVGNAHAHRS